MIYCFGSLYEVDFGRLEVSSYKIPVFRFSPEYMFSGFAFIAEITVAVKFPDKFILVEVAKIDQNAGRGVKNRMSLFLFF